MQIHCLREMSTNIELSTTSYFNFKSSFTYDKVEIYDYVGGDDNSFFLSVTTLP